MNRLRPAFRRWSTQAFRSDDRGQALIESVLVIPLILFLFFAIVQLLLIGFTYQAVKHAAFMAARSLAVHHVVDEDDAVDHAKAAACIVLVPASRPVGGEIPLMIAQNVLGDIGSIASQTIAELGLNPGILGFLNPTGAGFAAYGVRLLTARHRLGFFNEDQSEAGFRWEVRALPFNADISEVRVDVTYRYPLYVPGFSELWRWFRDGVELDDVFERSAIEQAMGMPASIPLPARAVVGYEQWSGEVRLESAVELGDEIRADGGNPPDNPLDGIEETLEEVDNLTEQAKQKAEEAEHWRNIQAQKEQQYRDNCVPMPDEALMQVACNQIEAEAEAARRRADRLEREARQLQRRANSLVSDAQGQVDAAMNGAVGAVNGMRDYLSTPCP